MLRPVYLYVSVGLFILGLAYLLAQKKKKLIESKIANEEEQSPSFKALNKTIAEINQSS